MIKFHQVTRQFQQNYELPEKKRKTGKANCIKGSQFVNQTNRKLTL